MDHDRPGMSVRKPNVFTIPASAPFLPSLIEALQAGRLVPGFPGSGDPLELGRATLYLPTRRACRLAREVFLDVLGTQAAILPRIVPLGDPDEDEIAFAEAATGALAEAALAIPPAIEPLERRLLLAELILQWANTAAMKSEEGAPLVANTPSAALALADDLARLMDDMTMRGVSWDELDGLVPDDLEPYWQRSLEFLKIARVAWPAIRAERGAIEEAERRDRLIEAEAKRLADSDAPVIAAGSTGSIPATARLLATIAHLPHGALVLPGLDTLLDDDSWALLAGRADDETHDGVPAASHPQFAMHALLARIGITRAEVQELTPPAPHGRDALMSEAMRSAATTERWQTRRDDAGFGQAVDAAFEKLSVIEAANPEEEALAIAIALRETLETPDRRAALVTPDRALARRVVAALARWQVPVDDSGGDALPDTPAGIFARLAAQVVLGGLEPVPLLALLKHPLLRLGARPGAHDHAIFALERAVLRGPRPRPGSAGLAHALATFRSTQGKLHANDPRKLVPAGALDEATALVERLAAALAPLESLSPGAHALAVLARCHRDTIAALSLDETADVTAFAGHDGNELHEAFEALIDSPSAAGLAVGRGDYAELFHTAVADRVVRRPETGDVRVHIYGPLEARLQSADRLVLGGLNEGTWPPEVRSDPWLSRPMRHDLGLDPPERRIGLSAHDFAQCMGAPEVILTRAAKVASAPTIRSRFTQRIAALSGARWQEALARGERYLGLARALDAPVTVQPAPRPAPVPPPEARPDLLSVTDIENWLRDPYTIYAKHVLRLFPLEPIDAEPGAADRGSVIHEAIGDFTKNCSGVDLPPDAESILIAFGEQRFAVWQDFPEARGLWWPRFKRIARWLIEWERKRRTALAAIHGEIKGKLTIPLGTRAFTLTARADRIERRKDGTYAILDYKTGQPPSTPQVLSGLAPQLTLEAAILQGGGFANLPAGPVTDLRYLRLKGGEPPVEEKPVRFEKGATPDACAAEALQKLAGVAARFIVDGEPYRSLVHPMWKTHYGDYDHLARVKEWAASGGESEAELWS